MNEQLNKLPVAETKETFWYREYWMNGKLIEKHHLFKIWLDAVNGVINSYWMRTKAKAARALMDGMADPCPYCNKLIDLKPWKKLLEDSDDQA